jgi:hypothetical protein
MPGCSTHPAAGKLSISLDSLRGRIDVLEVEGAAFGAAASRLPGEANVACGRRCGGLTLL